MNFKSREKLFGDTVSPNKPLFGDTVSPNKPLFGDTVSPNNTLFGDTVFPNKPHHLNFTSKLARSLCSSITSHKAPLMDYKLS